MQSERLLGNRKYLGGQESRFANRTLLLGSYIKAYRVSIPWAQSFNCQTRQELSSVITEERPADSQGALQRFRRFTIYKYSPIFKYLQYFYNHRIIIIE
jgi:hypothetical protein